VKPRRSLALALALLPVLLAAAPARALPRPLEQCLEGAPGEREAAQCWAAERARQDQRIAALVDRLSRMLRPDAERPGFLAAQDAWARFRDATCAWERRALLCCDLTEEVAENSCRVERAEARAADLERLLAVFGPGGPLSREPPAPAPPGPGGKTPQAGMIIPDSAERLLTAAELAGLCRAQLRLARNEIYARHGRIFDSPDLQAWFAAQPWYRPLAREVVLSPIERANVTLLDAAERRTPP
jgi:uncharacterized protein YecT (DUF1311 family)